MIRIEGLTDSISRLFKKRDLRTDDVKSLLAPGKIEELVRTNRTPVRIGSIGIGIGAEMQPYYQVPPREFNTGNVKEVPPISGVYVVILENKKHAIGPTFALTEEQAREVETRIKEEKFRRTLAKTR